MPGEPPFKQLRTEREESPAAAGGEGITQSQAEHLLASMANQQFAGGPHLVPFRLKEFTHPGEGSGASVQPELELTIELGRTRMPRADAQKLSQGGLVTLDQLVGDPVEIYVGGRLIARGDVAVIQDRFCVRVTELIAKRAAA